MHDSRNHCSPSGRAPLRSADRHSLANCSRVPPATCAVPGLELRQRFAVQEYAARKEAASLQGAATAPRATSSTRSVAFSKSRRYSLCNSVNSKLWPSSRVSASSANAACARDRALGANRRSTTRGRSRARGCRDPRLCKARRRRRTRFSFRSAAGRVLADEVVEDDLEALVLARAERLVLEVARGLLEQGQLVVVLALLVFALHFFAAGAAPLTNAGSCVYDDATTQARVGRC